MSEVVHTLSFDVEEWFQVANHAEACPRQDWDSLESRVEASMDRILRLLDRRGARATMFFLGWIAERHPALVRRCLDAGHEIASHGFDHRFLQDLDPEAFDEDLARTEAALSSAGAPMPRGFRASTFTLTRRTWWAFDVLVRRGYQYDSSVHPIRHPDYGVPGFEPGVSRVQPKDGGSIVEFPVSTFPLFGSNLPVGGGGYFRLLPGWLHRGLVGGLERRGRATATYLHPWEFDPEQPRVKTSWPRRFRHRVGLGSTEAKLDRYLQRFRCTSMEEGLRALGQLPG